MRGATQVQPLQQPPALVSIHAPVRGATRAKIKHVLFSSVSIHAPVRGATTGPARGPWLGLFQSTLPCEERPFGCWIVLADWQVSIHAPVRGATNSNIDAIVLRKFQSTLPCEERQIAQILGIEEEVFQSTLPCEERLFFGLCILTDVCFNPRSRARSDLRLQ